MVGKIIVGERVCGRASINSTSIDENIQGVTAGTDGFVSDGGI